MGRNVFPFYFLSWSELFLPTHSRCRGYWCTWSHLLAHTHSVGLLWTRDRHIANPCTWQHTKVTRDWHPYPRLDSNPQSQPASGRRLTPSTARPPGKEEVFPLCNTLFPVSPLVADTSHFALLPKDTAENGLITLLSVCSSDFSSKAVRFLPATEGGEIFIKVRNKKEGKKERINK